MGAAVGLRRDGVGLDDADEAEGEKRLVIGASGVNES